MRKSLLMQNHKSKEKFFFYKNIDILSILDQTKLLNNKNNDYP